MEKTCIFPQKWLYYLILMTSHLVAIETDHHQTCLKVRARDERTATERSGADLLSSRKKI